MNLKHGYKTRDKTYPEYAIWASMIQRCENRNHKAFDRYGGRGIKVCQRWKESFLNFLEDMGNRPSDTLSIERVNNDGHYEPSNCIWQTLKKQNLNKENTVWLIFNGEKMNIEKYAEINGISYQAACKRIQRARKSCGNGKVSLRDGTVVLRNSKEGT